MLIKAKRHSQLLYSHLLLFHSLHTSITSLSSLYPLLKPTFLFIFFPFPSTHWLSFLPSCRFFQPSLLISMFLSILLCIAFIPFTSFSCHPFSLHHLPASYPLLITSPRLLSTPVFPLFLFSCLLPPLSLFNNPSTSKHVHLSLHADSAIQ